LKKLGDKARMSESISDKRISYVCTYFGIVAAFLCLITMAIISLGDNWHYTNCNVIPGQQNDVLLVKRVGATLEDNVRQELQIPQGMNVSSNSTLPCWIKDRGSRRPDEISLTEKFNYDHITTMGIAALFCLGWVVFCGSTEACFHFKPWKKWCRKDENRITIELSTLPKSSSDSEIKVDLERG
jgi:hypothetical protein